MKKLIIAFLKKNGYSISKINTFDSTLDIVEKDFWEVYGFCKPYTMTSIERMYSLYCSVNFIIRNEIKGDFVECGVWKGGSAMLIAKMLSNYKENNRKIFLYDTFEGMSEPTEMDKDILGGEANIRMQNSLKSDQNSIWCYSSIEEVKENLRTTGFALSNINMIKGKVEDTIPGTMPPDTIALLRLDTDFYESTLHELNHLYPLLNTDGVLIIDDYGHWQGCKKAVDEYFEKEKVKMLLNRIDYTGRVGIKTSGNKV